MNKNLWRFTSHNGDFESTAAFNEKALYFPLANESLMSSVTPDLHGDAKLGQDAFLFEPVSRIDLVNSRSSRNFWVRTSGGKAWSATGVSKDIDSIRSDRCKLSAGLLWHRIERENRGLGLRSDILSFVPSGGEPVEVMSVTITNISLRQASFIPIAAIPIYGRSAENIRDHRHVTSLLNRVSVDEYGVIAKPTLLFSEAGHLVNKNQYFVMGCDESGKGPEHIYPTQEIFCGDGGDLEAPEAILGNKLPEGRPLQGREAFGGLRFGKTTLRPLEKRTFIIIAGIAGEDVGIKDIFSRFNTAARIEEAFARTQGFWDARALDYEVRTGDADFDNWFRWVSVQPALRRIFGCSFLPDFDYGKGGRGWRDLWQDCLGLVLSRPESVRGLLVDSFAGVRIDGSNATIIGHDTGEFISDRNNVSRVWMDHGVWPLLTLELYINETGDRSIISEIAPYFRNHECARSRVIDREWKPSDGQKLKTSSGAIYEGTIFEHLLLENLVQFFNVGVHNHIRLEGGDWNDGLDMAKHHGESVAFSAMYARNLLALASMAEDTGFSRIEVAEEVGILFGNIDYGNVGAKHEVLNKYFHATNHRVTGEKMAIDASRIAGDLRGKAAWMMEHIRKTEWLDEGFFNGYYDNDKERVEGRKGNTVRMMLASQVFPIMSGVALDGQVKDAFLAAGRYLRDRRSGGYHLNTDFGVQAHNLGRAFSFAYGDKENGAFFNHMSIMFANALYKRGLIKEGWSVLSSVYDMAVDSAVSKIFPCMPEYFDREGRGMYPYLTGSASWFVLTMMTEVFGLKGKFGDLLIEPKLSPEQFKGSGTISVNRVFAGRRFMVNFLNTKKGRAGRYGISKLTLDGKEIQLKGKSRALIGRRAIEGLAAGRIHTIDIVLT